jgi:nicotinamidase-related amidase
MTPEAWPMTNLELRPAETGLLLIDAQERLVKAMPEARAAEATRNTVTLLEAARRLGVAVVATEQYPDGLGRTVAPIAEALARLEPPCAPLPKMAFSALACPEALAAIRKAARSAWIVVGMETHVCVWQSVRALCAEGRAVHVVRDACLSRQGENFQAGLDLCARAGAVVTTTEVVVFDLLGRAGTDDFRALSKLVR